MTCRFVEKWRMKDVHKTFIWYVVGCKSTHALIPLGKNRITTIS